MGNISNNILQYVHIKDNLLLVDKEEIAKKFYSEDLNPSYNRYRDSKETRHKVQWYKFSAKGELKMGVRGLTPRKIIESHTL